MMIRELQAASMFEFRGASRSVMLREIADWYEEIEDWLFMYDVRFGYDDEGQCYALVFLDGYFGRPR